MKYYFILFLFFMISCTKEEPKYNVSGRVISNDYPANKHLIKFYRMYGKLDFPGQKFYDYLGETYVNIDGSYSFTYETKDKYEVVEMKIFRDDTSELFNSWVHIATNIKQDINVSYRRSINLIVKFKNPLNVGDTLYLKAKGYTNFKEETFKIAGPVVNEYIKDYTFFNDSRILLTWSRDSNFTINKKDTTIEYAIKTTLDPVLIYLE